MENGLFYNLGVHVHCHVEEEHKHYKDSVFHHKIKVNHVWEKQFLLKLVIINLVKHQL
jgi:hypothetical protein